jgi:hypothetical protein
MLRLPRKSPRAGLLVAVILAAAGATLGAQFLSHGSPSQVSPPPSRQTGGDWKVQLVHRSASQHSRAGQVNQRTFRSMRFVQVVPTKARRRIRPVLGPGGGNLGLDFKHAYYLKTSLRVGIWVVGGTGVTCLFNGQTFAMACDTSSRTARHGLVVVSGPSPMTHERPPVVALGIVPNGVHAVRLGLIGGHGRFVPVTGNTFALRAHRPIMVKGVRR